MVLPAAKKTKDEVSDSNDNVTSQKRKAQSSMLENTLNNFTFVNNLLNGASHVNRKVGRSKFPIRNFNSDF